MNALDSPLRDVMQVCRNGHVITELFYTFPDCALSHCDRCGAVTMTHCLTCGQELPGAIYVAEALPIGEHKPPLFCSCCGAAFPWARKFGKRTSPRLLAGLLKILRRLPRVARQLRSRHADRRPFCVNDEYDLEDLLRALLPLHFDDVRLEARTPKYASGTRTDFWLHPSAIAVTAKLSSADRRDRALTEQIREDVRYYMDKNRKVLIPFIYDPERLLLDAESLEREWAGLSDGLRVVPVIGPS
jgi:hypothetical protein